MRAGVLREKAAFKRLDTTTDAYGNTTDGTFATFLTVRCRIREARGRERVDAGALHAPMTAVLTVRSSISSRTVTEADLVTINGVDWNIRSITNPDMHNRWLEMAIERAVAQ